MDPAYFIGPWLWFVRSRDPEPMILALEGTLKMLEAEEQ
jgi:hypothetical protein